MSVDIENGASLAILSSGEESSLLLRTIAGIEPAGKGTVHLPSGEKVAFLPNPHYVAEGTLRQALAYPRDGHGLTRAQMRKVLKLFKLQQLEDEYGFDKEQNWSKKLDAAQVQRLCLARLFMSRPKLLFLEEPTLGLEDDAEQIFTLFKSLDATIVTATRNRT